MDHRVSAGIYHRTGGIPLLSAVAACGGRDTDHGNWDGVPADAPLVHGPLAGVDQLPKCEAGVLLRRQRRDRIADKELQPDAPEQQ